MKSIHGKTIVLDLETTGLDPYHGARMFGFSYFTDQGEYGFLYKSAESMNLIQSLFNDPARSIVFHNAKFDLKMLGFEGINIFSIKATIHCTLVLAKLYNETFGHGQYKLRNLAIRLLRCSAEEKDAVDQWINENKREFKKRLGREPNFSDAPEDMLKRRSLWDSESTYLLYIKLVKQAEKNYWTLYRTEMDLIFVVIDMENRGVRVDITRARELKQEAEETLTRINDFLNQLLCPLEEVVYHRRGQTLLETVPIFNPGSNQHLEAAFRKLQIKLRYKTEKRSWCFDEYAMVRYVSPSLRVLIRKSNDEGMDGKTFVDEVFRIIEKEGLDISESMPPLVLKYRELSKMVSTYYNAFIERSVDRRTISGREYGILHCSFNPSEAKTGRFSCSDPNLQNQPRLLGPRECFVPRNGRHNWHFDYEQIEMRLFAHFTRDIKMAKAIEKDIHLHVASEIYGLSLEKISAEQRKRAKMVNFGIIYGAGVRTLTRNMRKKGLDVTESEVTKLLADYHRRYPSVRKLVTRLKQELARYGFITNPFGRRYHIEKEKGYRGPNNLIQGTAADEMKQAMVRIWKELRKKGYRSRMIMTIHDEIVLEIPRNEETVVPGLVMKLMENLVQYFIPIRVDAKVSTHCWSKKTDPKKAGLQIAS